LEQNDTPEEEAVKATVYSPAKASLPLVPAKTVFQDLHTPQKISLQLSPWND